MRLLGLRGSLGRKHWCVLRILIFRFLRRRSDITGAPSLQQFGLVFQNSLVVRSILGRETGYCPMRLPQMAGR
jgi:hypothetical protein